MKLQDRINAFIELGKKLSTFSNDELEAIKVQARSGNSWFTGESTKNALKGLEAYLKPENLNKWVSRYSFPETIKSKKVGVVTAGNIPLVGFHDILSVLISGHYLYLKLSSEDSFLPKKLLNLLIEIEPQFSKNIHYPERLTEIDAIIATGSDNTSRYFEYYFGKLPHIFRKNRNSCAIINGEETGSDLFNLGKDIFTYYGLGCRNVSKLYVPSNFNFSIFYEGIAEFKTVLNHHKYANNYDYNKSVYLVNRAEHLDNGFLLLREETGIFSPISVLFYEKYSSLEDLDLKLEKQRNKIQCLVSKNGWYKTSHEFGKSQYPDLWDYADGIDTIEFLTKL